jgi:ribosomal protein S18 acetylase RimI-like enzyme
VNLTLQPARPEDAEAAARLITQTDAELFRYLTGDDLSVWETVAALEWRRERGIYCHTLADVVRDGPELLGLILSYHSCCGLEIDWSLGDSATRLPPALQERLAEARRTAFFLFPAIPDGAWYVQNIAVAPRAQRTGVGRFLMEAIFDRARAEGCAECHVDVDGSLPAVRFYECLGMSVLVETRVPSIPGVSAHFRMVKDLRT